MKKKKVKKKSHSPPSELSFSTRSEAEQYLAANGLAWEKKARRTGGRYQLVRNEEGTIQFPLFVRVVGNTLTQAGEPKHPSEVQKIARKLWAEYCRKGAKQ